MKKDKVGKKVFVIGSASRLEMDALRKAMEKVGLEKCEMWGCVGSMRRKRRLLVNSQILKTAVQRAEFAKRKCPQCIAVGFARGVVRKSAGKGNGAITEVAEVYIIGNDERRCWKTVEESANKEEAVCNAIFSAFLTLDIKA
jgi:hypothetical protein